MYIPVASVVTVSVVRELVVITTFTFGIPGSPVSWVPLPFESSYTVPLTFPVGVAVGEAVGVAVGEGVGDLVGELVGDAVGDPVGAAVGDIVGAPVGGLVLKGGGVVSGL
jgi:hypothetical protein